MTTDTVNANSTDGTPAAKKDVADKIIVHFMLGLRELCLITAALPLVTLAISFIGAVVFQFEETHENHCQVFNIIPSISAITGVSPQRYFWRVSIALHVGPRFVIAFCYKSYFVHMLRYVRDQAAQRKGTILMNVALWLHVTEITSLCGVTYISNRENYNLHEQVFIVFMICSLCHMLVVIKLCQLLRDHVDADKQSQLMSIDGKKSLKWKRILFALSLLATITMAVFFFKHRVYCHDLAFSTFAFCEYVIAVANLAFHCLTMLDFPYEYLMIAKSTTAQLKLNQPIGWKTD